MPELTTEELNALYNLAEQYAAELSTPHRDEFWDGIVEKLEKSI